MPLFVIENQSTGTIPIGTLIVVDAKQARPYNSLTDDIEDVIGTIYPTTRGSGRAFLTPDGSEFYINDQLLWDETLQYSLDENDQPIVNENYTGFNPYIDTDNFSCIITEGVVTVLKPYDGVPSRWKLVHEGTTYDWFLAR